MIGGLGAHERFLLERPRDNGKAGQGEGKNLPLGTIRDLPESIKRRPRSLPYPTT